MTQECLLICHGSCNTRLVTMFPYCAPIVRLLFPYCAPFSVLTISFFLVFNILSPRKGGADSTRADKRAATSASRLPKPKRLKRSVSNVWDIILFGRGWALGWPDILILIVESCSDNTGCICPIVSIWSQRGIPTQILECNYAICRTSPDLPVTLPVLKKKQAYCPFCQDKVKKTARHLWEAHR